MAFFKHRPLFLVSLAAVIFSVGLLPQLPPWWLVAVLSMIALLLIYRRYWCSACLILATIYSIAYGKYLLGHQLPAHLDNQEFYIVGVVKGLPQSDELKQRFQLKLEHLYSLANQRLPHRVEGLIRLSWYHPSGHKHPSIEVGQRWQMTVKLRRPRSFVNPVGFDYQVHLMSHGIIATGYVKPSGFNKLLVHDTHLAPIDRWRDYFKRQFVDWHQHEQMLSLMLALAIGDRSFITADQWKLLRDTGTVHLMAISGLHISLAAVIGFSLGLFCSRLWQLYLPMSVVSYHFPALFSMVTALLYSLLAGMSLPTQRALIMVLIFHLAHFLYRNLSPWLLLSIALVIIAIHDPLAVYNQGFWLSFLAVAVLLYGFVGHLTVVESDAMATNTEAITIKKPVTMVLRYLKTVLRVQWLLAVGLLIPGLFWLQGMSISAPFANSIAVPYLSLVIVPLLLLTMMISPFRSDWAAEVYWVTEQAFVYLIDVLQLINESLPKFMLLPVGQLPWTTLLLAGVAVIWLLSPRGFPYRYLSLLLLLPTAFPSRETPNLSVTFLDVGQGTSVIVETRHHVLVYDTGPRFGPLFNAGADIIAPYLRYRGHSSINYLIVSHADKDHAGGITGLMDSVAVEHIFGGETLPINQSVIACQQGQDWRWDGVQFTILWPRTTIESGKVESGNNASCVLAINHNGHDIILSGDIEGRAEKQILAMELLPRDVDILLVPHHGSRSSSSSEWVRRLSPQWAVVTAGYHSRYGHPHQAVLDRYLQQHALVLNTANQGAIQFILDEDNHWQVVSWRQQYRRYWHAE